MTRIRQLAVWLAWAALAASLVLWFAGCSATGILPLRVETIDPGGLPAYNWYVDAKTQVVICPKCFQDKISPQYTVDKAGHEALTWTCRNCGATWLTRIASVKP